MNALELFAHASAWHDPDVQAALRGFDRVHAAMLDPGVQALFDQAYARALEALRGDPFERERREAARLLDLLKARYRVPGLPAQFIGDTLTMPAPADAGASEYRHPVQAGLFTGTGGIGYWHIPGPVPDDLQAVFGLVRLFAALDDTRDTDARLWTAKRLIAALQRAQGACGEEPEPLALAEMTNAQKSIVLVMFRAGATTATGAAKRGPICDRLELHPDTVKEALARLREMHLIAPVGSGAAMAYHLTPEGNAVGAYLDRNG